MEGQKKRKRKVKFSLKNFRTYIQIYAYDETFIVPTPLLVGEELYTQLGFFSSVNFGRSIYSS